MWLLELQIQKQIKNKKYFKKLLKSEMLLEKQAFYHSVSIHKQTKQPPENVLNLLEKLPL